MRVALSKCREGPDGARARHGSHCISSRERHSPRGRADVDWCPIRRRTGLGRVLQPQERSEHTKPWRTLSRLIDALARILHRFLDAANEFGQLTDAEQDETEGGLESYVGLDEAQYPFTSLLRESHNATYVPRDLDGTLQLLWQKSSISDR